jgi:hypothetical protein
MNGKMKLILVMILLAGLVCILPVSATGHAQVIKFVEKRLNCYPDNNCVPKYSIPPNAAVGSLMYQDSKFVFNGHGLPPETEFTLIEEPWGILPPQQQIGTGISDKNGNILIKGGATSLTYTPWFIGGFNGQIGAYVWLVPTNDMVEGVLPWWDWNPKHYLFAQELISPP